MIMWSCLNLLLIFITWSFKTCFQVFHWRGAFVALTLLPTPISTTYLHNEEHLYTLPWGRRVTVLSFDDLHELGWHKKVCSTQDKTYLCTMTYNNQDYWINYCILTWKLHVEHNESYLSDCLASLALNTLWPKVDVVSKGGKRIQGQVSN